MHPQVIYFKNYRTSAINKLKSDTEKLFYMKKKKEKRPVNTSFGGTTHSEYPQSKLVFVVNCFRNT